MNHVQPFIRMGNATSHLCNVHPVVYETLRYDLAFDSGEDPTPSWDGWVRLMTENGVFSSGLVPNVRRLLDKYGFAHQLYDMRGEPDQQIPLHVVAHRRKPRDYQLELAHDALRVGRGVIVAPPRAGKTFTGACIYDLNPLPTVWIAPTRAIVTQTVRALEEALGPGTHIVALMGGKGPRQRTRDRIDARDAHIVVTTAATAVKLGRDFFNTRGMLIIDEFHHAAADTYQEINRLAENIYYRFGMTGTHFRSDENTEILMNAVLSVVVGSVDHSFLIERGFLAPADVMFLPIEGPVIPARATDDAYRYGIAQHQTRNEWVVWATQHLLAAGKRVIVLVKWVEKHGAVLHEMLGNDAVFVHGKLPKAKKGQEDPVDEAIRMFNKGHIDCLIGTSVLGEGIDLPAADALVYAKAGRASVTVTQDFHRVLTANEGKQRGIVVDFTDRHSAPMLRHAVERGKLYARYDDFNVEVLDQAGIAGFAERVAR